MTGALLNFFMALRLFTELKARPILQDLGGLHIHNWSLQPFSQDY